MILIMNFEDVSLDNQENRKLNKALDLAEIDVEELKREHPELYKELKRDIADIIAATGRVPKSLKGFRVVSRACTEAC